MNRFSTLIGAVALVALLCSWGFFGHKKINQLAVFTLPPEMIDFYKKNIDFITEAAVNPDKRRFSVVDEAPRHYIDLDHYGDSAVFNMPRTWSAAVAKFSEDTLKSYGIVPWHVFRMYNQLREAFMVGDPERILKASADLGHYIGDAHVPLHTTENYNGQLTGQEGIHGLWESRLVELFSGDYDFFVGKAEYVSSPQQRIWEVVVESHLMKDSVLLVEKQLTKAFGDKKYSFETKGKQTVRGYSSRFSKAYHKMLNGMVERRMRSAVHTVGCFWYSAWVDAGQPDLKRLVTYQPSEEELTARRRALEEWKEIRLKVRDHE